MSRWIAIAPLLAVFLASPLLAEPELDDPIPLYKAVSEKQVIVTVLETRGYGKVRIRVKNLCPQPRQLRIPGTYLRPATGNYQRLALGYDRATRSPDILVRERTHWEGWVTSCCMDSGKSSPGRQTAYSISCGPVSKPLKSIMEFWAENPSLSQGRINRRVWDLGKETVPKPEFHLPGIRLLVWGGRLQLHFRKGTVLRCRDDGRWEVLATDAESVDVGPGGLWASFVGGLIRQYNESSREWVGRGMLDGVDRLLPGTASVFAHQDFKLYRLESEGRWRCIRSDARGVRLGNDPRDPTVCVVTTGGRIAVAPQRSSAWRASRWCCFTDVLPTSRSLIGTSSRGMFKLDDKGFARVRLRCGGGPISPWARGFVQIDDRLGQVMVYHEDKRIIERSSMPAQRRLATVVDPVTGDIFALLSDRTVSRLCARNDWQTEAVLPAETTGNVDAGAIFEPRSHESGGR